HYVASVSATSIGGSGFTGFVRPEDLATPVAIATIGVLWLRIRIGRAIARDRMASGIWIGIAIVLLTAVWAVLTLARRGLDPSALVGPLPPIRVTGWYPVDVAMACLVGFALTLPLICSSYVLPLSAHELPPP